ncbi:MAG: site-specific DNA-methyltransferase [candidate division WOR-3 bacterium]
MLYNAVYFGDYKEFADMIPDRSVDLILTDPPWSFRDKEIALLRDKSKTSLLLKGNYSSYLEFCKEMFNIFSRVIKLNGNVAIFHNLKMFPTLLVCSIKNGFKLNQFFVYVLKHKPGGKGVFQDKPQNRFVDVCEYISIFKLDDYKPYFDANSVIDLFPDNRVLNFYVVEEGRASKKLRYLAQKPEIILRIMVRALCPPGGIVYDPFLGSGTIIPVCIDEKRYIIGSEIDRLAQDLILHRIIESGAKIKILRKEMEEVKV